MDVLEVLEKKVVSLLELVNKLKAENLFLARDCEQSKADFVFLQSEHAKLIEHNNVQCAEFAALKQENNELKDTVEALERSVLESKSSNDQEKAITKMLVEDLISSIDSLVEQER